MDDAVLEFGQFRAVPPVCGAYEVTGDSLQSIYPVAVAFRAFLKIFIGVFKAAVHAAVPVVVHGAVTHVVFVHEVYYRHYRLRIVGGVAINFHIEYVSASRQAMVRSLDFSLVLRCTVIIYRHMVGVGVVFLVCDSRYDAEFLPVGFGEPACEAFCRSGEHAEVVLEFFGIFVDLVSHVGDYPEAELLSFLGFPVMFADKGYESLGKSDEADSESALVDDGFNCVVFLEMRSSGNCTSRRAAWP